jgi:hypothetical protein
MPTEFNLDHTNRLVYSRAKGDLTDEELLDHLKKMRVLFEDGVLDAAWAQICDFSTVETFAAVTSDGVRHMALANPWPKESIRVLIAPTDIAFGLVRMYKMLGAGQTSNVHITRFAAEAQAIIALTRARNFAHATNPNH